MPLFMTEEEFRRCVQANDAGSVAEKADAYIRELFKQVETVRAEADAGSVTAEQTCSLLEQKYISLSSEFAKLDSQNTQLQSSLDRHLADLALLQSNKHQRNLHSIGKDGEIERLATEVSELHKSKRQLIELAEQKDLEISEKNATIKSYLDKIVNSFNSASQREVRVSELESELARTQAACTRLKEEKELVERHNAWLNDELTAKVDSVIELRRKSNNLEDDMSTKLADVERQFNECSSSLQWHKERVRELEMKLTSLQEELCSSKAAAAANEERLSAELSTVLYELEEKAKVILEERVEHERMAEAYSMINQRLQNSLSEQANLEKTIQELKKQVKVASRSCLGINRGAVDSTKKFKSSTRPMVPSSHKKNVVDSTKKAKSSTRPMVPSSYKKNFVRGSVSTTVKVSLPDIVSTVEPLEQEEDFFLASEVSLYGKDHHEDTSPVNGRTNALSFAEGKDHHEDHHEDTSYVSGRTNALSFAEGGGMDKFLANEGVSPPISSRLRELSNNLKLLCSTSSYDQVFTEIVEPKAPLMEQSRMLDGMKSSLVQEFLKFLNTADKEDLKRVKGIGEKRATYIVELREESPEPLKSLDDLTKVGLSEKQIQGMMKKEAAKLFS